MDTLLLKVKLSTLISNYGTASSWTSLKGGRLDRMVSAVVKNSSAAEELISLDVNDNLSACSWLDRYAGILRRVA